MAVDGIIRPRILRQANGVWVGTAVLSRARDLALLGEDLAAYGPPLDAERARWMSTDIAFTARHLDRARERGAVDALPLSEQLRKDIVPALLQALHETTGVTDPLRWDAETQTVRIPGCPQWGEPERDRASPRRTRGRADIWI